MRRISAHERTLGGSRLKNAAALRVAEPSAPGGRLSAESALPERVRVEHRPGGAPGNSSATDPDRRATRACERARVADASGHAGGYAEDAPGLADHLVGEAPFVVVPGHHLDQRAVHDLG